MRNIVSGATWTRNGTTPKTLITDQGRVPIDTPRDRNGTFKPQIVRKRQRRFKGFDEKILALYSRGLSTRDIEAHLEEIYGVKVGRELISKVTDAVMEDVRAWAQRPLEDVYPVIFLDALVLKIREGGTVQRRACYLVFLNPPWFGELTTKLLRRGAHRTVRQLNTEIRAWIEDWNEDPRPYVWTKPAERILESISRYCQRINPSAH